MRPDISLSIFFPAYNEEANIETSVREAENVVRQITPNYEIIIVDDGSKDNTGSIADLLALKNDKIKVVHHSPNRGYGAALWSGIKQAKYDWVFFTDADLQFKLDELKKLVSYIPNNKVVLGYRAPRRDPFMRLVNAKGWNFLNRIFFGLKVRDIDCAFKLFDRRLVSSLPLVTRGATMSAEMLIRLQRLGIKFREVPVTHLPRLYGEATGAKPAVILRAFKELFALYRGELGLKNPTYLQVLKFGIIGGINTLIDVLSYVILTRFVLFFGAHILMTKIFTFALGTISSFILNRKFTFAVKGKVTAAEIARFYSVIGMGMIINVGVLYIFSLILGVYDLVAVGISTVLTFIWGFVFTKIWVFAKESKEKSFSKVSQTKAAGFLR